MNHKPYCIALHVKIWLFKDFGKNTVDVSLKRMLNVVKYLEKALQLFTLNLTNY